MSKVEYSSVIAEGADRSEVLELSTELMLPLLNEILYCLTIETDWLYDFLFKKIGIDYDAGCRPEYVTDATSNYISDASVMVIKRQSHRTVENWEKTSAKQPLGLVCPRLRLHPDSIYCSLCNYFLLNLLTEQTWMQRMNPRRNK